jgi:hypothetical protein
MRGRSPPRGGPPRGGGRGRSPPRGARRPSPPRRGSPPRRRYSRSRCQQHTASLCHPVYFSMFVYVCMSVFLLSVSACLSFSVFVLVCIRKSRDVQLSYDDTKSSDRHDNSILTSISEDNSMFTPSRIFHYFYLGPLTRTQPRCYIPRIATHTHKTHTQNTRTHLAGPDLVVVVDLTPGHLRPLLTLPPPPTRPGRGRSAYPKKKTASKVGSVLARSGMDKV